MTGDPSVPGGRTAVCIPYYQKNAGLLRRAVESVLAQRDCAPATILIVDDGSPHSARLELQDLPHQQIRLIEQRNRGAATARNTALNAVEDDVEFIAFLDSDDWWHPYHLKRALSALNLGYDFFFSNLWIQQHDRALFDRHDARRKLLPFAHPTGLPFVYEFRGDTLEVVLGCLAVTSTIVYRRKRIPGARFVQHFRTRGEDQLFWFNAMANAKVAFSTRFGCVYGRGLNVSLDAPYGSLRALDQACDDLFFRNILSKHPLLSPTQREKCHEWMKAASRAVALTLLHRFRRGRFSTSFLRRLLRTDHRLFLDVCGSGVSIVSRRLFRKPWRPSKAALKREDAVDQ